MTTQSLPSQTLARDYAHIKQLPDPPHVHDLMSQLPAIMNFVSFVNAWFRDRDDVLAGGCGYLWKTPDDGDGPNPDGAFVSGVPDAKCILNRNGYVISEVGKPPDLVLEVGAESGGRRDCTERRDTYAEYGVPEYWRFDPSGGRFYDAALAGDRLVNGKYEPVEILTVSGGHHWGHSEVLGLEFWWVDGVLRLRDPVSGRFSRTMIEIAYQIESNRAARLAAEAEAKSHHAAQIAAKAQIECERVARLVIKVERTAAEAQIESERAAQRAAQLAAEAKAESERDTAATRIAKFEDEIRRLRDE